MPVMPTHKIMHTRYRPTDVLYTCKNGKMPPPYTIIPAEGLPCFTDSLTAQQALVAAGMPFPIGRYTSHPRTKIGRHDSPQFAPEDGVRYAAAGFQIVELPSGELRLLDRNCLTALPPNPIGINLNQQATGIPSPALTGQSGKKSLSFSKAWSPRPPEGTVGRRVFAYRNLHAKNQVMYSLKDLLTGRVMGHAPHVEFEDPQFHVGQAGRQRVIDTGQKNVHAGVRGTVSYAGAVPEGYAPQGTALTYNPFKYSSFVNRATKEPVKRGKKATLSAQGLFVNDEDFGKSEDFAPKPVKRTPNPEVRASAQEYNKNAGLPPIIENHYVPVDEGHARKIADAYEQLPVQDDGAVHAYTALGNEINAQWDHAHNQLGMHMEPWTQEGQPYANSAEMHQDVANNKHLFFFTGGEPHPFLGAVDPQSGLSQNDKFRAVHDLYGHAAEGYGFGARGEENAWIKHSQMFSPLAQQAMTSETRGQNSWVNFGRHNYDDAGNYIAPPAAERPYADQKSAVLPAEFLDWKSALARSKKSMADDYLGEDELMIPFRPIAPRVKALAFVKGGFDDYMKILEDRTKLRDDDNLNPDLGLAGTAFKPGDRAFHHEWGQHGTVLSPMQAAEHAYPNNPKLSQAYYNETTKDHGLNGNIHFLRDGARHWELTQPFDLSPSEGQAPSPLSVEYGKPTGGDYSRRAEVDKRWANRDNAQRVAHLLNSGEDSSSTAYMPRDVYTEPVAAPKGWKKIAVNTPYTQRQEQLTMQAGLRQFDRDKPAKPWEGKKKKPAAPQNGGWSTSPDDFLRAMKTGNLTKASHPPPWATALHEHHAPAGLEHLHGSAKLRARHETEAAQEMRNNSWSKKLREHHAMYKHGHPNPGALTEGEFHDWHKLHHEKFQDRLGHAGHTKGVLALKKSDGSEPVNNGGLLEAFSKVEPY